MPGGGPEGRQRAVLGRSGAMPELGRPLNELHAGDSNFRSQIGPRLGEGGPGWTRFVLDRLPLVSAVTRLGESAIDERGRRIHLWEGRGGHR